MDPRLQPKAPTQLPSLDDIQKEIEAISREKAQAQAVLTLAKLKAERALGFPDMPDRTRGVDALALEKSLRSADPSKYLGETQKSLNEVFTRKSRCWGEHCSGGNPRDMGKKRDGRQKEFQISIHRNLLPAGPRLDARGRRQDA